MPEERTTLLRGDTLIERSGGYGNPYLVREMDQVNHPTKQPVRDIVCEYILRKHSGSEMRLCSLPSVAWAFESQISIGHRNKVECLGIERKMGILRRGLPYMPGKGRIWGDELFGFTSVSSSCARVIHAEASTFFSVGNLHFPRCSDRKHWSRRWRRVSAFWLDFTGQLCREIESTLPQIDKACSDRHGEIPVAVTVMKSREKKSVTEKMNYLQTGRVGYIERLLNGGKYMSFRIDDVHEYFSTVPMLVVMGCLFPRK